MYATVHNAYALATTIELRLCATCYNVTATMKQLTYDFNK